MPSGNLNVRILIEDNTIYKMEDSFDPGYFLEISTNQLIQLAPSLVVLLKIFHYQKSSRVAGLLALSTAISYGFFSVSILIFKDYYN